MAPSWQLHRTLEVDAKSRGVRYVGYRRNITRFTSPCPTSSLTFHNHSSRSIHPLREASGARAARGLHYFFGSHMDSDTPAYFPLLTMFDSDVLLPFGRPRPPSF